MNWIGADGQPKWRSPSLKSMPSSKSTCPELAAHAALGMIGSACALPSRKFVMEIDQREKTPVFCANHAHALAELGEPAEIGKVFAGFQKHLYAGRVA